MWRVLCALWLSSAILFASEQADNQAIAQRAVEAEREGDFTGAISAFQQLLRNGADSPELRNNLGIAYFQLRDYGSALPQFQKALVSDPNSIPGNLFSGLSLVKLQRPKQALPYLEKARRAQPSDVSTMLAL